jgi:hypothetical protein
LIGPEIESDVDAGFPLRNLPSGRYERLTNGVVPFAVGQVGAAELVDARNGERASGELASGELAAPWWLWWNILSFDAPMVAVAWALVFAKSAGVALPAAEIAALGLVVWLIYTVDRLLDGQWAVVAVSPRTFASTDEAQAFGPPLRQRHVFHRVHAGR